MSIFLQLWGGVCYLLNKVLLSSSEGSSDGRLLRLYGWSAYALGLPAWVIILASRHNWMAAAIEVGGGPAMALGIFLSLQRNRTAPPRVERLITYFSYGMLMIGSAYSLYDFHGIRTLSQFCELGVMAGFLIGTNLLAKRNPQGWAWFALMNLSMGLLMMFNGKWLLVAQQVASLGFVCSGYVRAHREKSAVRDISLVVTKVA